MERSDGGVIESQLNFFAQEICERGGLSQSDNGTRKLLLDMYDLNDKIGGGRRNSVDRIDQGDPEYWDTLVTSYYWRGYCDNRYFDEIRTSIDILDHPLRFQTYTKAFEKFWDQCSDKITAKYVDEIKFHPGLAPADIAGDGSLSSILIYDPENEGLIYKIFEPTNIGSMLVQGLEELSKKTAFHPPELFLYLITKHPITSPRWVMSKKEDSVQGDFLIETFAENVSLNDFKEMYKQKNDMREGDRISFLLEKDLVIWNAMKKVQTRRRWSDDLESIVSGTQEGLWEKVLAECVRMGVEDWQKPDTVKSRWWKMQDRLPGRVELDSDNRLTFV